MKVADIIKKFPPELRDLIYELVDAIREEAFFEIKQWMSGFKNNVEKLTELYERMNERMEKIEGKVNKIDKLEEALYKLEEAVRELREMAKKHDRSITELAEAQRRIEERLNILATELEKLVKEHRKTREQLGGISHAIGYTLEDRAFKYLPELIEKDYGIKITNGLRRDYIRVKNTWVGVNIFGEGIRNGEKFLIIGEGKSQVKKRDIDNFIEKCLKVEGAYPSFIPLRIIVTYIAHPSIREYIEDRNVRIYLSYQFGF
jgi:uncharacterized protein YoxC